MPCFTSTPAKFDSPDQFRPSSSYLFILRNEFIVSEVYHLMAR